jgi:antitoxin component YwqK of YwqJK toxin-antitoxin module
MKHTFKRLRIGLGYTALAISTVAAPAVVAKDTAKRPATAKFQNMFTGDVSPTNYNELRIPNGVNSEVEVIRERYPDGSVNVERQVTLNAEGNYVNHGVWKQYTTMGDVAAEGQYNFGQRVGLWTRWINKKDAELIGTMPFSQFKAPFMSQANFTDGKIDGEWTITDASERKVMTLTLKEGQRNGTTTFFLPNGKIYWQMNYENATPVGDLLEVNKKNGEIVKSATYDHGHKIITKTENYHNLNNRRQSQPQIKSQVNYLAAKSVAKSLDDFWGTKLAIYGADGADVRHGAAKTWFSNGQEESDGFYLNGKRTGTFTNWHENGQMESTGEYRDDLADGTWIWWYGNGQKSSVGRYENGKLIGEWRWWSEEGKLTKTHTYNGTESAATEKEEKVDVSKRAAKTARE